MAVTLLVGALMLASIYGLIGIGYSLIYKASGVMMFVQGELVMLGAYLGYMFFTLWKLPYILSFLLVMAVMFALGYLIERLIIRRIFALGAGSAYVIFGTLALSVLFLNGAGMIWGTEIKYFSEVFPGKRINIAGTDVLPEQLMILLVAAVAVIALNLFLNRTRFGLAMRVAVQDRKAAQSLGINVSATTAMAWGLSSMLAGVAGILLAPIYGVTMAMGSVLTLKGFASAIIGGYGEISGALIGALILGVIETYGTSIFPSEYKNFLVFTLLIIMIQIMPRGIMKGKVYDDQ